MATLLRTLESVLAGEKTVTETKNLLLDLHNAGYQHQQVAKIIALINSRKKALAITTPNNQPLIDTCGTGGDKLSTYNISTACALLLAKMGYYVAKHGNRASSSQSGSADVLEQLGVKFSQTQQDLQAQLLQDRFIFLFAPDFHPSLKHVALARKQLDHATIFNYIGPMCNPAPITHQLIGVSDSKMLSLLQQIEASTTKRWFVRGEDGMDEVSPLAKTLLLTDTKQQLIIDPALCGINQGQDFNKLVGGNAKENATALRVILSGLLTADHPLKLYQQTVVLNTAICLWLLAEADHYVELYDLVTTQLSNKSIMG